MNKKETIKFLIKLLFASVGVLVVLLVILSLVTLFVTNIRLENTKEKNVYQYRHLQYNPEMNEPIVGFISTYNEMTSDYITYENSDGNHILISNYGTREFLCSVKCYCENSAADDIRRTTVGVMRTTIIYLVAAVSSFAAYNLAKDNLRKKCVDTFPDCPYASLVYEDDKILLDEDEDEEEEEEEDDEDDMCRDMLGFRLDEFEWDQGIGDEVEEGKDNPMIFVNFMCDGHCLKKDFYYESENDIWHIFNGEVIAFPDFAQTVADDYGCEDMKLEQIVDFLEDGGDIFDQEKKARKIFTHSYLALFCEDHSHVRFDEMKETHERLTYDEIGDKDDQTAAVCLGYDRKNFQNPYVYCRKTSQEADDNFDDIETGGAY